MKCWKQLTAQVNEFRTKYDVMERALNAKLNQKLREVEATKKELLTVVSRAASQEREGHLEDQLHDVLSRENESLKKSEAELMQMLSREQEEVAVLRQQLTDLQTKSKNLEHEHVKTKDKLAREEQRRSSSEKKEENTAKMQQSLAGQHRTLQQEHEGLRRTNQNLKKKTEKEINSLRDSLTKAETEVECQKSIQEGLEVDIEEARKECTSLRQAVLEAQTKVSDNTDAKGKKQIQALKK